MYGSRHHDTGAVGTAPLPAGDGRGADQKRRPLRMVPRKGHRGGVSAIVPLETEHSERRVFKPERAGKVITAAMKQSLKAYRPELLRSRRFARPQPSRSRGGNSSPTVPRRCRPQAKSTCPRRSAKASRRWSSSAPKAISQTQRSLSRVPTDSRRSPSARSACAPKPQPSSPRSWRRWPTPDNKTAGRGA